jgi:phage terminase large subunit-like protein
VQSRYGGTKFGRQELEGVLIEEADGALWTHAMLDAARVDEVPVVNRIVVAVDPPVTSMKSSDECGIVVVGADTRGDPKDWKAVVLEDASVKGATPEGWARAALAAMERHQADRLVAEVNQGGDLVEQLVRMVDPLVPFRAVHATRSKMLRAEPVAALYEQGRVRHVRGLGVLEEQMGKMTAVGWQGAGSPDRLDALVWALTDLMLGALHAGRPSVRSL